MPQLLFAGEPMLHDFNREADGFLEKFQRLEDAVLNGEFNPARTWQGNPMDETNIGLPLVNWPKGPPLKLGQLYWPVTGASRWAEGLFLCTGATKRVIDTCNAASVGATLRWETDDPPTMDSLLGTSKRLVEWKMWPLAFRRVAGCEHTANDSLDPDGILPASNDDDYDLYLVHLVDQRYWWQFVEAEDPCTNLTSWLDIVDYLCTQLGITMLWATQDLPLPTIYTTLGPHQSELSRPYHNAAQLLDAVLESIGARLVATTDAAAAAFGGFELHRYAGAEACFLQNLSTQNLQEQLAGTDCNLALTRALPAYVNVAFPKSRFGMLCGQCDEGTGSTEEDCHEAYYVLSHALSEYMDATTYCPVASTAKTIHIRGWADMGVCTDSLPMNSDELILLANQIANDWFLYHQRQYDFTTVGPTAWDACGYDDSIIHKFGIEYEDGQTAVATTPSGNSTTSEVVFRQKYRRDITSRIQSLPLNVGSDCQLHHTKALELPGAIIAKTPSGGIAAPVGDVITGVLCTAYRVVGRLACGSITRTKITAIDSAHLGNDYMAMVYQPICGAVAGSVFIDTGPFKCCARRVLVECCPTGSY